MEQEKTMSGTAPGFVTSRDEDTKSPGRLGVLGLAFLAVLVGFAGAFAYIAVRVSPPRLELAETVVDFGEVPLGNTVSRSIAVTNRGGRTLQILKVAGSCGCTESTIEKTVLEPNESTRLNLQVVRNTVSPARIQVSIESNSPENPVSVVTLFLKRPWEASVTPSSLQIHGVSRASLPITRKVYLKTMSRTDGVNVGAVKASASSKHLEVRIQPHSKNTEFDINIAVLPDAPAGSWRETVRLTDSNGLVDSTINVDVNILSSYLLPAADVTVCPNNGSSTAADTALQLGRRDAREFEISQVTRDDELRHWIDVEMADKGNERNSTIVVRFRSPETPNEPRPAGYIRLLIHGDHGDETFCIPVSSCPSRRS